MLRSDAQDNVVSPQEEFVSSSEESWLDRPLLAAVNLDWEKALYALFITLAVLSRLWNLGLRVMSHDETVHIQWSWYLFQGRGYEHTPLSHGPFLFETTALSYYLFGDNDVSARLVPALLGIVLVALPYTLRRWLGRSGALAASFFFLISPSLLYYSRYIRHDIPVIVWSLIAILAIFRYLEQGRTRWLTILAASLSLMFATKEVAFIYVATFGLFLILLFLARLGAPRWQTPEWERLAWSLLWIAAGTLLLATLAFGLSGIVESPDAEGALPSLDEVTEPEAGAAETTLDAADLLHRLAVWAVLGTGGALLAYVGLLAVGSPSHQRLVLTALGLGAVVVVAMGTLLFSLNLVELFPIRHSDCAQAPTNAPASAEQSCPESGCAVIQGRCQRPISVMATDNAIEFDQNGVRTAIRLTRFEMLLAIILVVTITTMTGVAVYILLDHLMPFQGDERPALDLILFVGSFSLPFVSPLAINGLSRTFSRLFFGINAAFNSLDYSEAGLLRSAGFVFILLAVSVAVGLWWDWRRWLPAAGVFFVIFVVLFTTVFTNGNGMASGMVGSVGYWLEQQAVQRGSQPPYYYALLVPLYEYLPLIGFIAAVLYALIRGLKPKDDKTSSTTPVFILFLFFWTVLTWLSYTAAGEKMPWLTTHFAVPMALAAGWVVGQLIDSTHWRTLLRRGGWIVILMAPVGLAALVQTIGPWLTAPGTPKPFSGQGLGQLNATMQFIAAFLMLVASLGVLYWVWQRIGPAAIGRVLAALALGLLGVLTVRTAWTFAYINQDYASEFLVYAHSTPDVREVMEQIEDISRRTSGELSLDIAYTGDGSYPFIWYLRNYPNAALLPNPPSRPDLDKSVVIAGSKEWSGIEPYLGDNYACNQYNFLWWPMQDYFNLTWDRVRHAITNPEMRAAMWDIIFRRDYNKYEQATGKTVRLSQWPQRNSFRFCIRRDVVAQVWSESAGPVAFVPSVSEGDPNLPDYAGLEQSNAAELVISELGDFGNLNNPHDMALDADGYLYVADSDNHRIVKFSPEGQVVDTWDSTWWHGLQSYKPGCLDEADRPLSQGDGEFCEPWGIAVGPAGKVYVADTWNHRIQVFTPDGQFLSKVGTFGQSGNSVLSAPAQFYGPRDITLDQSGRIYVSDTGNKRVQVFDNNLNHLFSFGGPGIGEGQLDEPVGLAIGPNNLLYVADTWNQRVQAFALDGNFDHQWPIVGWDGQSTVNKPFLATDSAGRVYVSDPEGPRVIVFDSEGTPLAVFGGLDSNILQLPIGVVLGAQDRLWTSDAATDRLLRFPPLDSSQPMQNEP
jgi:uncharacterized protein (TIGR03663 family)